MKVETREIYKCDHCKKMYQLKRFCERHELMCYKNPDNNRACYGCMFLVEKTEEVYSGVGNPYGEEGTINVKVLYCSKKDVFVYPPKVAVKRNMFDMGEKSNEEMPKECDLFKNGFEDFEDINF